MEDKLHFVLKGRTGKLNMNEKKEVGGHERRSEEFKGELLEKC